MTKSELVQYLSVQSKEKDFSALHPADMREAVDRILDLLADALAAGGRIELRDFGVFRLHEISARQGRNPKTGEPVAVPSKKRVHFKAGREMRARADHG
jgi:integration host factor subunit beta